MTAKKQRRRGVIVGPEAALIQSMLSSQSSSIDWSSDVEGLDGDQVVHLVVVAFSHASELPTLLKPVLRHNPRIVGVAPTNATLGMNGNCVLDALVLRPASAAALHCAIEGLDAPEPEDAPMDALASINLFGFNEQSAREQQLKSLSAAFGASHIFLQVGTRRLSSLQDIEGRTVQEQAGVASALSGRSVVAPLANKQAHFVETTGTYLGEFLYANQQRIALITLCTRGARRYSERELELFHAVCQRLGQELWWTAKLKRVNNELRRSKVLSVFDPGTGVWSPGALQRVLSLLIGVYGRTGEPVSVAHIDVANLKTINSKYGHAIGDAVIEHLQTLFVSSFRTTDLVARVDGGFVCIFQGAQQKNAKLVLDRVRDRANESFATTDAFTKGARLEFVAGMSSVSSATDRAEDILERAKAIALQAKLPYSPDDGPTPAELMPQEAALTMLPEGALIADSYRILHEISSGAVGVVYRAEDMSLQRPVAIKILRPSLASDQEFVESFRREAALLASLRHDNIVQVFTAGIDSGRPYFVMELVEGQSVAFAIRNAVDTQGALSREQIVMVVQQIGSALDALHQSGLVHRDIKPANILLDPFRGRTVLVDVGIAWRKGTDAQIAGTPGYIAPEVLRDHDFSLAADIYGLAVTCYEMLTGQLPWKSNGEPMDLLRVQRDVAPQRLSAVMSSLAPLDEVIMKGLSSDPNDRWKSAGAFAKAFEEALSNIDELKVLSPKPARAGSDNSQTVMGINHVFDAQVPMSRGIVFKQFMRVIGPRETEVWRNTLSKSEPELANALSRDVEGRAWLPTETLWQLFQQPLPPGFDAADVAGDLGKATVRATFRRLFPARGSTLSPNRIFAAMPKIWGAYHNWGDVESSATGQSGLLRLQGAPPSPACIPWVVGMLEQLIVLSGGSEVQVTTSVSTETGAPYYSFEASWLLKRYAGSYES